MLFTSSERKVGRSRISRVKVTYFPFDGWYLICEVLEEVYEPLYRILSRIFCNRSDSQMEMRSDSCDSPRLHQLGCAIEELPFVGKARRKFSLAVA